MKLTYNIRCGIQGEWGCGVEVVVHIDNAGQYKKMLVQASEKTPCPCCTNFITSIRVAAATILIVPDLLCTTLFLTPSDPTCSKLTRSIKGRPNWLDLSITLVLHDLISFPKVIPRLSSSSLGFCVDFSLPSPALV